MEDEKYDAEADTAQRLLSTWKALHKGKLRVAPHLLPLADEFMAAPLTLVGLVDTSSLSPQAISFGRASGMAMSSLQNQEKSAPVPSLPIPEIQSELFGLFARLFGALTGRAFELIKDEQEIHGRMLQRVKQEPETLEKVVNEVSDELIEFYKCHATSIFQYAKKLGGMRLVTGGQRTFGPSALNAVRITGLYADTQLIPDPIYPFLSGDLHLNAQPLQLAINLFHILQLRPLVNLELPVPPVFVFPSFEEALEEHDGYTMHGIEQLSLRMIGPLCDGTIASTEDLFDYAKKQGDNFAQVLLSAQLFIPPGGLPNKQLGIEEAVKAYINALEGVRDAAMLKQMKALPSGVLLLNGVLERLRPHYHLLENSGELGAQPLLSQPVHWHYFEKCATANAEDLRRNSILSDQAFQTLKAVQDDSLSWLANIPVQTLGELIANNEHQWFREELNGYTTQLASSGVIDTNTMVREISHGLASLVQRQQRAMTDIERKYAPKKMAAYFGAGSGLAMAATVLFLPALSPLLGIAVPAAAATAAIGGGLLGYGKEKIGEKSEKQHAERSLLGVLATARPRQ